jgi:hypothetical protein
LQIETVRRVIEMRNGFSASTMGYDAIIEAAEARYLRNRTQDRSWPPAEPDSGGYPH